MRIVGVVVAGIALLCSTWDVHAAEPKRERSEKCLEICNFDFEKCTASEGPKGHGRCNIDVVRCKNACPFETVEVPAVPTVKSHQRCIDDCRETYNKCLGKPENKNGGNCAAEDMRCEKACPVPPEVAAAASTAPAADGSQPAPAAAPAPRKKPRRAARVEGAAAPAPAPAPPAPPIVERVETPPPTVRSEGVTPPAPAPAAPAAAAARPAQQERGFFGKLGCFFVSCDPVGSSPCLQQCGFDYDECSARESKRGGECNTRLMHCRKACSNAAPVQ